MGDFDYDSGDKWRALQQRAAQRHERQERVVRFPRVLLVTAALSLIAISLPDWMERASGSTVPKSPSPAGRTDRGHATSAERAPAAAAIVAAR